MDIEENTTVMDDVEFLKRKYLLFFYVAVLLWTLYVSFMNSSLSESCQEEDLKPTFRWLILLIRTPRGNLLLAFIFTLVVLHQFETDLLRLSFPSIIISRKFCKSAFFT